MTARTRKVGKAAARNQFSALVDSVERGSGPVEITDYGKVVAFLISAKDYASLLKSSQARPAGRFKLCGSVEILGDLEEGSRQVAKLFRTSIQRSGDQI